MFWVSLDELTVPSNKNIKLCLLGCWDLAVEAIHSRPLQTKDDVVDTDFIDDTDVVEYGHSI